MYGAPYDLLSAFLGVRDDRARDIVARWRRAGYAATGRLGPGPAWCWLTPSGPASPGGSPQASGGSGVAKRTASSSARRRIESTRTDSVREWAPRPRGPRPSTVGRPAAR